jgi:hypothetical protein
MGIRTTQFTTVSGTWTMQVLEGTVINHQTRQWAATHVHGGGGGGYIGERGGYVSPTTVNSTTTEHKVTEFWLQDTSGTEHHIELKNNNLAVANGQTVKIGWLGGNGRFMVAHNKTAQQTWDMIFPTNWGHWGKQQGLLKYPLPYRLLTRWVPFVLALYVGLVWVPALELADQKMWATIGTFLQSPSLSGIRLLVWPDAFSIYATAANLLPLWKAHWFALILVISFWWCLFALIALPTGYLLYGAWWKRHHGRKLEQAVWSRFHAT